ncbi:PfkB family carbohydrate kinase [Parablautia sp. Marseille-Q6255]|uniref:PfkB family carbohydrate kinase n=1 Tax=Parablautia sp. Marseille-Q6255 TaxID=3039593 RepID=UPI0024BC114A|nr:PfkB family carbohydrate kinase [Parablautia sp. Marseille-Q6255]
MTQREQELYDIIRENPSISQNEIAQKMNISRSAVSVYLNELYKKKILLGRGYILNEKKYPVVIGPAHVDIRSIKDSTKPAQGDVYLASKVQLNYGGSAKNVVNYLFHFAQQTRAILVVGDDDFGSSYINDCTKLGILPSDFIVVPNTSTLVYNEFIDEDRNNILSYLSQSKQMELITPIDIQAHSDLLDTASIIIVHDSIPVSVAEYLHVTYPNQPMFLIGSGEQFTIKLQNTLSYYCSTILPMNIAAMMAWKKPMPDVSLDSLPDICRQLVHMGLSDFYIMANPYTMVYCDGKSLTLHTSHNPSYTNPHNFMHYYSDCRDILVATICYYLLNGLDKIEVLDYLAAARNLANSKDFYFEQNISIDKLKDSTKELHPKIISKPLTL